MRFRKKPVEIDAVYYDGVNQEEIRRFLNGDRVGGVLHKNGEKIVIDTLEGSMSTGPGTWIIRGIHGEYYPCQHDIFLKSYESVE